MWPLRPAAGRAGESRSLYALKASGATEIVKIGGAQAIAALAVGTSVKPVEDFRPRQPFCGGGQTPVGGGCCH
ncbi:MAG: histidinol dehydrogenase [Akkermansia sp.]